MKNPKKIKDYIVFLNSIKYPYQQTLYYGKKELKAYHDGFNFLALFYLKIYLVFKNIKKDKQARQIIRCCLDPYGNRFLDSKTIDTIMESKKDINHLFQEVLHIGGSSKKKDIKIPNISPKELVYDMEKSSKYLENKYGHLLIIPLELTNMMICSLGTISQLIASTIPRFILPPPMGWVPGTIGNFFQGIHIFSNGYNIMISFISKDWNSVIQNSVGILPQFLVLSNGLSLQLISVNRFLKSVIGIQDRLIKH